MSEYLIAHIGHTHKHHEHVTWWKPDSCGYTICIDKAGRYSEERARGICTIGSCIAVLIETASAIARSTPYRRDPDGTLVKLYDGDQHRPVPNDIQSWKHLLDARLGGCAHPDKPTPKGVKARAIYLPDTWRATDDLSDVVARLARALRKAAPDNDLSEKALDYLRRKGFKGSPLRNAPNA